MPVGFSRVRIAGFKSFAEPATLEIAPGLTGIVGPNGCGKSNVVEALRWAMGEQSAKSLRGDGMDDVIFAGSAQRPARNLAEVALTLEAAGAGFPPPFTGQSELEVTRRIERGSGSTYRVNGREARARDVQTLFADLASGARGSAMVSQGRVGHLVGARPEDRRALLEEASGIGGLSSRKHEAELKLRQAEANAARAEDLRQSLLGQLEGLKKQARQAARWRSLGGLIRAAEAEYLAVLHARASGQRTASAEKLAEAGQAARQAGTIAAAAADAAARSAAALPPLRAAEAEARTALERARIAAERSSADRRAAREALIAADEMLARLIRDRAHGDALREDADRAIRTATLEAAQLADAEAAHPGRMATAEAELAAAEAALEAADQDRQRATIEAAEHAATARAAADAHARAARELARLESESAELERERSRLVPVSPESLTAAAARLDEAIAACERTQAALARAEADKAAATEAHDEARTARIGAESLPARLAAEAAALTELLASHAGAAEPLIDAMRVPAGLEAALAAGLGELLDLASDPAAPRFVTLLPPLAAPEFPPGVSPLGAAIEAPPALVRALAFVGLCAPGTVARPAELAAGQILVDADGAVWRWDGFTQKAGAPGPGAIRLMQRNRLAVLRAELALAETTRDAARTRAEEARRIDQAASAAEAEARAARRAAETARDRAAAEQGPLVRAAETIAARIAALHGQAVRLSDALAESRVRLEQARAAAAASPDPAAGSAAQAAAHAAANAARARALAARALRDGLIRDQAARSARRVAIDTDRQAWQTRAEGAAAREAELARGIAAAEARRATLAASPALTDQMAAETEADRDGAERRHRACTTLLHAAEAAAAAAAQTERAEAGRLAQAREAMLRAEAEAAAADHSWGVIAERCLEKLGAGFVLPAVDDPSPEAEEQARRRAERLTREQEQMGPVNLRAEIEAGEITERMDAVERDRAELTEAIHKLRGSISTLNRAGRERLAQIFAEVDRHFRHLFTRMFGGGRAHLALVGSDDPLEAGLEIYAEPPGKKLATLSLLSGGEQALTALSLIFAVFRCNPAPVAVLDEVDAPLDDANIERFCQLLTDMVAETGTRFLVVTHHHWTMARMDRLYGVTMQERGVSQLLSVDLGRAAELADGRGGAGAAANLTRS